jgi:basic membrane protein A
LSEATTQAAKEYPKIYFIGVDQTQPNKKLPNLTGLIFPDDQVGFLAGALAAQLTKSGKIGAVFPSDSFTYIWRLGEGYRAGAHYIKPELEVEISYHNNTSPGTSFSDPEWGATSAVALVEKGADIIFSAGEKTAQVALVGAVQAGALGIGSDFDQYYALPEAQKGLVTSILKLVTPGVFSLIEAAQDDTFPGGNFTGQVNYASFHSLKDLVPDNVKANLNKTRAALLDGSLKTNVPATKP